MSLRSKLLFQETSIPKKLRTQAVVEVWRCLITDCPKEGSFGRAYIDVLTACLWARIGEPLSNLSQKVVIYFPGGGVKTELFNNAKYRGCFSVCDMVQERSTVM